MGSTAIIFVGNDPFVDLVVHGSQARVAQGSRALVMVRPTDKATPYAPIPCRSLLKRV